jgi:hypothetical protein
VFIPATANPARDMSQAIQRRGWDTVAEMQTAQQVAY